MPAALKSVPEEALRQVKDFNSFLQFLRLHLGWPVPTEGELLPEDLSYRYLAEELKLEPDQGERLTVRQLIPLHPNQPWGIFFLEFNSSGFYRTWVRQVMRALAQKRKRDPRLPQWHHEHLLFVCTPPEYRPFTFGPFAGERATGARLTTFTLDPEANQWRTLCEYNLPALRWPVEDGRPPDPHTWWKQWKEA